MEHSDNKIGSNDPSDVPAKVNVFLGDIGKQLAKAAKKNNHSLGEEIRQRLKRTIEQDKQNNLDVPNGEN